MERAKGVSVGQDIYFIEDGVGIWNGPKARVWVRIYTL